MDFHGHPDLYRQCPTDQLKRRRRMTETMETHKLATREEWQGTLSGTKQAPDNRDYVNHYRVGPKRLVEIYR
jgi:hypothetical protein